MYRYKQTTGELFDANGSLMATGYAGGNCGKNPEGKNNPAMQNAEKIGPLPEGVYAFGQPILQSHLGPFAIPLPLVPDASNVMFGRKDFFCHGDTTPSGNASQGCIIMPRLIRDKLWTSSDHAVEVVQ